MGRKPNYDLPKTPKWVQEMVQQQVSRIEELEAQVEELEGIVQTLVKIPIDDTVTVVYGGPCDESTTCPTSNSVDYCSCADGL